jgi:hypothetical protein
MSVMLVLEFHVLDDQVCNAVTDADTDVGGIHTARCDECTDDDSDYIGQCTLYYGTVDVGVCGCINVAH